MTGSLTAQNTTGISLSSAAAKAGEAAGVAMAIIISTSFAANCFAKVLQSESAEESEPIWRSMTTLSPYFLSALLQHRHSSCRATVADVLNNADGLDILGGVVVVFALSPVPVFTVFWVSSPAFVSVLVSVLPQAASMVTERAAARIAVKIFFVFFMVSTPLNMLNEML